MWETSYQQFRKTPVILIVLLITTISCVVLLLIKLFAPVIFQFIFSYVLHIIIMAYNDDVRIEKSKYLTIAQEYKLHEMEMAFNKEVCKHSAPSKLKTAWLTAMMNDNYAIGAVFVGYALRRLSCHERMIALVSDGVSNATIDAIKKVGYDVKVVEPLDCDWLDRKRGKPERNKGIPGTYMRLHAWNYTEYDAIVYLDVDAFPLNNVDELFLMKGELAASYCSRPGIIDPCFNAGLLMFKPSLKSYHEIMEMWKGFADRGECPSDQELLWHYYADPGKWTALPYAYNVRRHLYHPMKVYHFACGLNKKPWQYDKPAREAVARFNGPFRHPQDMIMLWWKYFYEVLDTYDLHEWFEKVKKDGK